MPGADAAPSPGRSLPEASGPSRVIGEASRDRACRVSVGRDKRTGKYVVRWRSDGRHRSRSFTYQRDAERWDREQKRSRELGVSFEPLRGAETLAEVVEGWWKAHVVTLEENTRDGYRTVWTRAHSPVARRGHDSFTHSGSSRCLPAVPRRGRCRRGHCGEGARDCFRRLPICRASGVNRCEPGARRAKAEAAASALRGGSCTVWDRENPGGVAGLGTRPRRRLRFDVGIRRSAAWEARALRWSNVRAGSLLIERAVARRAIKAT